MTSRIEPHRVSAYNTSKHSENKMHDDTVAKRYGFIGGLVPGVDVMAYMMHLPVAKWGRAFLERGLIEARFVKPVYDGELADVTGEESNGVLAIQIESRGELCATGTASLPATTLSTASSCRASPILTVSFGSSFFIWVRHSAFTEYPSASERSSSCLLYTSPSPRD